MMTLLCLTTANGFCGTKNIYVNVTQIKMLDPCYGSNLTMQTAPKTNLHLNDGTRLRVFESPDDVIRMIKQITSTSQQIQVITAFPQDAYFQHDNVIHLNNAQ